MATTKKPQDHKSKVEANPDSPFVFTHDGETFELAAPSAVLTAGFSRKNRHKTLEDQFFTLIEALADDAALAAIDDMRKDEFQQFQIDFYAHSGADLGE
jgi:hypothetical protein